MACSLPLDKGLFDHGGGADKRGGATSFFRWELVGDKVKYRIGSILSIRESVLHL